MSADDGRADLATPPRGKLGIAVFVVLLHVLAVLGLIRAFAPEFTASVTREVVSAFNVTISPPPEPAPTPPPQPTPEPAGASGEEGRKATPRDVKVIKPRVAVASPTPAPQATSSGTADSSGARDQGSGTGAGGSGSGTGSGAGGDGTGAGGASRAVKIAGDINAARDYPRASRDLRLGDHVIVALTVGTDGRVKACRAHRASRDPEADRITCQLATQRFRFRPATDRNGNPVESVYGWKQWWTDPRGGD